MLKAIPEIVADKQDGSRKALAELTLERAKLRKSADAARQLVDAQMKVTLEHHARELDTLRNSFKACESELLQERDKWLVEQEKFRTRCHEKSSHYHDALSTACWLVPDSTSGEGRLEEFVSK